jgi:hypothetical protein
VTPRGFTDEEWTAVLDEYDRRCTEARLAAGLPEHIEDPDTLKCIVGVGVVAGAQRPRSRAS